MPIGPQNNINSGFNYMQEQYGPKQVTTKKVTVKEYDKEGLLVKETITEETVTEQVLQKYHINNNNRFDVNSSVNLPGGILG